MAAANDIASVSADTADLLSTLVKLGPKQARSDFLKDHLQLRRREAVEYLTDDVVRLLRVDLQQAHHVASTAIWLADEIDDDFCRGRSHRAAANVAHHIGDHAAAASLFHTALSCFQRIADEKEEAITRSSALRNLGFLGEIQLAYEWAARARQVFEAAGDRLRLARLELNFANILFRQDRWEEAANSFEAAYREFQELGHFQDVAISLRNMAVCHASLNNFRQALEFYGEAREYCVDMGLPLLVTEIDYNIAYLYYLRGEYTRAIEMYQATRVHCEKVGDRYHMALCDLDQTEIFLELNLVGESVALGQRAYAGFEELGMQYESAKALVNMGIAVSRQGKSFLTLELLNKARDIFTKEENHVWLSLIDLYQALVMYKAGRPLEAARGASKARSRLSSSSLRTRLSMCDTLLACIYMENGELAQARKTCLSALDVLKELDVPAVKYQVYFVLGQIEEAQGRREQALESFRQSQLNLERLRSHLQADELKISLLEDKLVVYEYLVALTFQGGGGAKANRFIFDCFELAKMRSLADLIAFRAHALPPTSSGRSDRAKLVGKLREELNWYYRQIDLQAMRGDEKSESEVRQLRAVSRRQEDHLIQTLREFQLSDQEYSSLQDAAAVDVDATQATLPEDTLIVEYYMALGTVYVCVLRRDSLEVVPVTVDSRARELLRIWQLQLSKSRLVGAPSRYSTENIDEATRTCLCDLFNELLYPIIHLLNRPKLVIVPHGFLQYVPFHALLRQGRFLIEDFSISYAPSASVYSLREERAVGEGDPLVLSCAEQQTPWLREEAMAVAATLPGARFFEGADVDQELLATLGQESRYVYIGATAYPRQDNPMFSSIKLGDSRLNLFDLYNLRLRAEVFVLSSCGTSSAVGGDGDEVVGLTRGLLYAGAESVLTTLWHVEGQSSSALLCSFFRRVTKGVSKAESLREAMLEVKKKSPHPFSWAPFVLSTRRPRA